jgi:hypothetical protein
LSIPLQSNHAGSEEIHALVKALVEGDTSEVKLLAANNAALAQLELARFRKTRALLFNDINVGVDDAQSLKWLAALDRLNASPTPNDGKPLRPFRSSIWARPRTQFLAARAALSSACSRRAQLVLRGNPTTNSQITDAALKSVTQYSCPMRQYQHPAPTGNHI